LSIVPHGPHQRLSAPWKIASLGALAAALAVAGLLYNGHAGKAAATTPSTAVPVVTSLVTRRDMPVWLTGVGSVTPINVVDVKARADGQLARLFFAEGDEVKAGQLLAQIDPRPYQAALMQAQAVQAKDSAHSAMPSATPPARQRWRRPGRARCRPPMPRRRRPPR
jgi:multidrug efflux system membrane fusion protein